MRLRHLYGILVFLIALPLISGCFAQDNPPKFDADRAFEMLKKQCDFGPRPPGTEAHRQTRDFLYEELKKYADSVVLQNFDYTRWDEEYEGSNIIATFGNTDGERILLCAHWDTRPTADEELDAENREKPILGANDGASGVAVLLELARMFHIKPPAVPITIILFDAEDLGPTIEHLCIGSRYYASKLDEDHGFRYGILLDMIGDKDLQIYRERYSEEGAKFVNDKIWAAAKELGHEEFHDSVKYRIYDDHVPLLEVGVPVVNVIDFDFPYWHTLKDTVDKCSPESLKIVGETISHVVYSEEP